MKEEREFQTQFGHFLKYNFHETAVFELKVGRNGKLPFSHIAKHQIIALTLASTSGKQLYYKIPDTGLSQKPFDCFLLSDAQAFLVVTFEKTTNKENKGYYYPFFFMIPIERMIYFMKTSNKKHLTPKDAEGLGWRFNLKNSNKV